MPFVKYAFLPQPLIRIAKIAWAGVRELVSVYVLPISTAVLAYHEFRRRRGQLRADVEASSCRYPELHSPRVRHILFYVTHERYWQTMCFVLFWLVPQLLFGLFPSVVNWIRVHVQLVRIGYLPVLSVFLGVDVIALVCLVWLLLSSVAPYGPTNVVYALSLRYATDTGVLYRCLLQSLPRADDSEERQAEQWEFTRAYLKELSGMIARKRLTEVITAFICIALTLSCVSLILSTAAINHPLITTTGATGVSMAAKNGIIGHVYFFLVTFATIGYGDLSFVNQPRGYAAGVISAMLVMLTGFGLVSYMSYYIVNFKDRLLSGINAAAGGKGTPCWLWQSLRDV